MSKVVCMKSEGYAKSTGKLVLPSSLVDREQLNAIIGITDAMSDSVPLWSLQVRVARARIGKDAFQEADIVELPCQSLSTITKVRETADIPRIITEAVHIATTGRPGPVVIDLP